MEWKCKEFFNVPLYNVVITYSTQVNVPAIFWNYANQSFFLLFQLFSPYMRFMAILSLDLRYLVLEETDSE